jgi:hypothetical protein
LVSINLTLGADSGADREGAIAASALEDKYDSVMHRTGAGGADSFKVWSEESSLEI